MNDWAGFDPSAHGQHIPVLIRSASLEDCSELARFAPEEHKRDGCQWARRLIDAVPVVLVAYMPGDGHILGWSGARPYERDWLVAGLYIDPSWRRCGIGQALLRAVCAAVKDDGEARLLSIANIRNQASLALHETCGFRVKETVTSFAGVTFEGGVGVLMVA